MDRFYADSSDLLVIAYDAFCAGGLPQIDGDVVFYDALARQACGDVLELACGSGRIALPLAEAGLTVTGVDYAPAMLAAAQHKAAARPSSVRDRLTWVEQEMAALALDRQFFTVIVAFRSFQHLLTVDHQRDALIAIRRHLAPGGRLALHMFDPRLELLVKGAPLPPMRRGTDAATGRSYVAEPLAVRLDPVAQLRHERLRFTEYNPDGRLLREQTQDMTVRWTYRWELHHLLSLCGFTVEEEYSDFHLAPPRYGDELIVVAKAD